MVSLATLSSLGSEFNAQICNKRVMIIYIAIITPKAAMIMNVDIFNHTSFKYVVISNRFLLSSKEIVTVELLNSNFKHIVC